MGGTIVEKVRNTVAVKVATVGVACCVATVPRAGNIVKSIAWA
jgi:hypothetical protein